MAKTRRAYTGGAASTTTSSVIAASGTTSFTITAYTGWPYGSDPFFVVVEPGTANEEKILVTRTGSTDTTINVYATPSVAANRGADGTSSVAHSSGVTVFPVFTALDADEANELTSAFGSKGDLVSYGSSTFETLGVGTNDEVLIADSGEASGLKWGSVDTAQLADDAVTTAKIDDDAVTGAKLAQGYTYHSTVYFTSSGTFTKATYPWLRAIKVIAQGGGGAGGGGEAGANASEHSIGIAGGGGACGIAFETDIAGLSASVTVTVGAGGVGSSGGAGSSGGQSTFTGVASGDGGSGGGIGTATSTVPLNGSGALGSTTGSGDIVIAGGDGTNSLTTATSSSALISGNGGSSFLGGGGRGNRGAFQAPGDGNGYGGGGGGASAISTTAQTGGDGAPGIVIVELYA